MTSSIVILVGLAVVLGGPALTPADPGNARDDAAYVGPASQPVNRPAGKPVPQDQPEEQPPEPLTAEDVLKALLRQRPPNRVIRPASAASRDPSKANLVLLPEGASVVGRTGTIEYRAPWWVFVTEAEADRPLKLLPNTILERMVHTTTGALAPVRFVVSGEMTVFEGENYLLPVDARRAAVEKEHEQTDDERPSVAADASAEAVREVLKNLEPNRASLPSERASVDGPGAGAPRAGHPALLDGTPLVNRPGRIVYEAPWWSYVLESAQPDRPEPPLKLLPNKSLELMVEAARHGESGLVFVVSGEVTAFGSDNFLLPRVAMRRINLGNLRK